MIAAHLQFPLSAAQAIQLIHAISVRVCFDICRKENTHLYFHQIKYIILRIHQMIRYKSSRATAHRVYFIRKCAYFCIVLRFNDACIVSSGSLMIYSRSPTTNAGKKSIRSAVLVSHANHCLSSSLILKNENGYITPINQSSAPIRGNAKCNAATIRTYHGSLPCAHYRNATFWRGNSRSRASAIPFSL